LAKKYLGASEGERKNIQKDAQKIVGNDKNFEFYLRVMSAVDSKGKEYIKNELSRLEKMMANENVKGEQKDSFNLRYNVLHQFE
jgi:hypothetical protein